jgi:hypothetical protein
MNVMALHLLEEMRNSLLNDEDARSSETLDT